jgi:hypothetical protein
MVDTEFHRRAPLKATEEGLTNTTPELSPSTRAQTDLLVDIGARCEFSPSSVPSELTEMLRCPSCGGWRNDPNPGCLDAHHQNLGRDTEAWFQDFIYRARLTAEQSEELRSRVFALPNEAAESSMRAKLSRGRSVDREGK